MREGTVRILGSRHDRSERVCELCDRAVAADDGFEIEVWGRFTGDRKHVGIACRDCLDHFDGTFTDVAGFHPPTAALG